MNDLFTLSGGLRRDPRVEAWLAGPVRLDPGADALFAEPADGLRRLAAEWFGRFRACGPDVREVLHEGYPVALVGEAAFGYVNAFKAHVNVGFFHGAALADPAGLLEGAGKRMRHVKLRADRPADAGALSGLIAAAYGDIRGRLDLG